jgi:hypothetical protein
MLGYGMLIMRWGKIKAVFDFEIGEYDIFI